MRIENGTYCVYVHINKANGKMHVGQTIYGDNPQKRWHNGLGYKGSTHFWNAIQKYGWDNFEHEVVANHLTAEEADNFEQLLIKKFDTTNMDKGYNIEYGGTKNKNLSDETKQKLSELKKGMYAGENNPMYGISPKERMSEEAYAEWKEKLISFTTSEEFKQKMREKNLGKKYSDEVNKKKGRQGEAHSFYGKHHTEKAKEKIRQANIGKKDSDETKKRKSEATRGEKNPFYGKKHSEETRKKMSTAQRNRYSNPNERAKSSAAAKKQFSTPEAREQASKLHSKPVLCIETGQIYPSALDAKRVTGINNSNISGCCLHYYGCVTAGGYHWIYVYDTKKKDGVIIPGAISLGYITREELNNVASFEL